MIYALGYLLGCYHNYKEYVSQSLTDSNLESTISEWS